MAHPGDMAMIKLQCEERIHQQRPSGDIHVIFTKT